MSHFSVMVKVPASKADESSVKDAVADMLNPYQENNMGDCPDEYLVFFNMEEELEDEYKNDSVDLYRLPRDVYQDAQSSMNQKYPARDTVFDCPDSEDHIMVFPHNSVYKEADRQSEKDYSGPVIQQLMSVTETVNVSMSDLYPTLKEYVSEYCGYRDEHEGSYGYWENPNAKWDWWVLGGRWSGKLITKEKVASSLRSAYAVKPYEKRSADIARIRDLDFEAMQNDEDESGPQYTTWAVLDEDGWHEAGEMGWWGMSSATEDDKKTWFTSFHDRWIADEDPDTFVAIVDCHI